jgi:hypothetical protein
VAFAVAPTELKGVVFRSSRPNKREIHWAPLTGSIAPKMIGDLVDNEAARATSIRLQFRC